MFQNALKHFDFIIKALSITRSGGARTPESRPVKAGMVNDFLSRGSDAAASTRQGAFSLH
jgi:hypothetical protein